MYLSAVSRFSGACAQDCTCGVLWQLCSHVTTAHFPPAPCPYQHLLASVLMGVMGCSGHPSTLSSYSVPTLPSELMHVGPGTPAGVGAVGGGDKEGSWGAAGRRGWNTRRPLAPSALGAPRPSAGMRALVPLSQPTKAEEGGLWTGSWLQLLQHGTRWVPKRRHFFLRVLEAGSRRLSCPQPWCLVRAGFLACRPHLAAGPHVGVGGGGQAVGEDSPVSSHKGTNPITGPHPPALGLHRSWTSVPSPGDLLACFLEPEGLGNDNHHSREGGPCLCEHYRAPGISHRLSDLHPALTPSKVAPLPPPSSPRWAEGPHRPHQGARFWALSDTLSL